MIKAGTAEIEYHETEWGFQLPEDPGDELHKDVLVLDSEEQARTYLDVIPDGRIKSREIFITVWADAA